MNAYKIHVLKNYQNCTIYYKVVEIINLEAVSELYLTWSRSMVVKLI